MAKSVSRGTCQLCKGEFPKGSMSRHLAKCLAQHSSANTDNSKTTDLFHLVAEGAHDKEYWLHLAAPASARLLDLDGFLRNIWLECCGHLSLFNIGGTIYSGDSMDGETDADWDDGFGERSMSERLSKVLAPGLKFAHEYDFGSTTHLKLKVISQFQAGLQPKGGIQLLARNNPPEIACRSCGRPATKVDTYVGWFCDQCVKKSDEESFLPVVNSPRVGVCGYTG